MSLAPDVLARLRAALAARYLLADELGRGGMATVYRAHDPRHGRPVAIKVLRPELASALGPERFLREIAIAAGLNHPHILPLFDSGEAAGFLYYVMPLVEGESLRQRLDREKQLPLDEALRLTREVADALGAAHSRGIVHRDIKPENILLHGDHAVVSDFGIARAISAAGGAGLTETGIAIGTPAYMSPEQAAGEREIDGRSDLYSLACVTYEMLIGHPPFSGVSAHELYARHMMDPIPPLRTARDTIPESVEEAIARSLAKMPADRYATAQQFVAALSTPSKLGRPLRSRRISRTWMIGVPVVAFAAVALLLLGSRHQPHAAPRVFVLSAPSNDTADERWFVEGVTGEINNRLTQVSGLSVIGSQSVAQFAASGKSLRDFGKELDAQYALPLTFEFDHSATTPRRVIVRAQLIRVADGEQPWGSTFVDTLASGNMFDTEARIAEDVAQALDVTLHAGERTALHMRPTQNPDAYNAYLRGNQHAHGLPRSVNIPRDERLAAIAEYQRAVSLDSGFAEAHAMLAIQYAREATTDSALAPAREQAARAVALRPDLALSHYASAECAFSAGDWPGFQTAARVSDELGQNAAELLEATAVLFWRSGDYDRMARNFRRAAALDPLSAPTALALGVAYFGLHQNDEAEASLDRAMVLDSTLTWPYVFKAWLELSWHGQAARASDVLQDAVQRFGRADGFAGGFLGSYWWVSRLLARDPWYQAELGAVSPSRDPVDSLSYYMHMAGLSEGLHHTVRARAYWDSTARVAEPRLRHPGLLPGTEALLREDLALSAAGMGNRRRALDEASRAERLIPSEARRASMLGLVYAELGDADSAAAQFERAVATPGWVTPVFLSADPTFEPLLGNPRFRRLLAPAS